MSGGGMDTDGMEKLLKQVKSFRDQYEPFVISFMNEMGNRALAKMKKRSPVDTGTLRRSWEMTGAYREGDDIIVMLENKAEYAMYVEEGHRTRAGGWWEGYHMARISIAEIEKEMPPRFERAMRRFLESLGGD